MITAATIATRVNLDHREIPIVMLTIYGFGEADIETVTGIEAGKVKKIREILREKLGGINSPNMGCHALYVGFNIDGTFKGEEIFTDDQKRKILLIDDCIQFRNPPGKKK
jgi:hypothetical protein